MLEKVKNILKNSIGRFGLVFYSILFFLNLILKISEIIYSTFHDMKNIRNNFQKAAVNNYRLGKIMLSQNKINDAHFRFFLSKLFYNKSPKTLYYLSYINFIKNNMSKSLTYIEQALTLDSSYQKAIELFHKIESREKNNI